MAIGASVARAKSNFIALTQGSMYADLVRKRLHLSLAEANALIPTVGARLLRIMQLSAHLRRDAEVAGPPGLPWLADPVLAAWNDDDNEKHRAMSSVLEATLRQEVAALEALGARVKDLTSGLLDFYSYLDGETEVFLCWRLGEPQIRFFHGLHTGVRGRRSVDGHVFCAQRKRTGEHAG